MHLPRTLEFDRTHSFSESVKLEFTESSGQDYKQSIEGRLALAPVEFDREMFHYYRRDNDALYSRKVTTARRCRAEIPQKYKT